MEFNGNEKAFLTIYDMPYQTRIDQTIKRFNEFLYYGSFIDFESSFDEFERILTELNDTQALLGQTKVWQREAQTALAETVCLFNNGGVSDALLQKQSVLELEVAEVSDKVLQLEQGRKNLTSKAALLVTDIRRKIDEHRNHQLVNIP